MHAAEDPVGRMKVAIRQQRESHRLVGTHLDLDLLAEAAAECAGTAAVGPQPLLPDQKRRNAFIGLDAAAPTLVGKAVVGSPSLWGAAPMPPLANNTCENR